jgi:hypothetical protein
MNEFEMTKRMAASSIPPMRHRHQINLSREFMMAVLPSTLERNWDYRFAVQHMDTDYSRRDRVAGSIRAAKAEVAAIQGDLRWGVRVLR